MAPIRMLEGGISFSQKHMLQDEDQENAGDQAVGHKDLERAGQGVEKRLRKKTHQRSQEKRNADNKVIP